MTEAPQIGLLVRGLTIAACHGNSYSFALSPPTIRSVSVLRRIPQANEMNEMMPQGFRR